MPHSAPTAVLNPGRFAHDGREPVTPADLARTERDELGPVRTERDVTAALPPSLPGATRTAVLPDDPYGAWVRRAHAAGHPVQLVAPGRYRPQNLMPLWSWAMPPNDLLDVAREEARRRVDWIHAVLPDQLALLTLHRCVVTPVVRGRRRRPGGPTATPWFRLVAQQHAGLCAMSDTRDGLTTHVLEIPVAWLDCHILRGGPPVTPGPGPGAGRDDDPESLVERRTGTG